MKKIIIPFFIIGILFYFFACKEEPSGIGSDMLSASDKVVIKSINGDSLLISSGSFKKNIETGSGSVLLIGKYKDAEAYSVIKFVSIGDTFTNRNVIEANLYLYPTGYAQDNNTDPISISAYKINTTWSGSTLDSTAAVGLDWDKSVQGSFEGSVIDTQYVKIPLNPSLVIDWLDSSKASSNQGVILLSNNSTKTVRSFYSSNSSSYYPYLQVIRDMGGTRDSVVFVTAQNAYYAKKSNFTPSSQYIFLQSGISYRSRLKFDLTTLPKFAYISNATLILSSSSEQSYLGFKGVDSVVANIVTDSTLDNNSSTYVTSSQYLDNGIKKYKLNITSFVQHWVNNNPNYGLDIIAYGEMINLDIFVLYSEKYPDKNKVPKLTITYFTAPK